MPSDEYTIVLLPEPTATHLDPFHFTPRPTPPVPNGFPTEIQLVPFVERATVSPLEFNPTATQINPFQAIPLPSGVPPDTNGPAEVVQVIPLDEYASVFEPLDPRATHNVPFQATLFP